MVGFLLVLEYVLRMSVETRGEGFHIRDIFASIEHVWRQGVRLRLGGREHRIVTFEIALSPHSNVRAALKVTYASGHQHG